MQIPAGRDEARQFLEALFPEVPAGLAVCVWQDKPKRSHWLASTKRAAEIATFEPQTANMYFGCCLGDLGRRTEQRIKADEARAMPGLWMDFDYGKRGHEKANLPPDEEAIRWILTATPFRPSILVYTGGGVHAYWLFHELLVFDSPAQRDAALQLNQRMQAAFRYKAKARGWDQDSTFNLDRVLRIPGTRNVKTDPPRPCRVMESSGLRYNPSDLEEYLDAHVAVTELARVYSPAPGDWQGVALSENSTISQEMLDELKRQDPRFEATWEKRRSDLSDQSMSGYDMALANFAAMAQMTRQQAVDLMMAFRGKHGNRKPRTLQYFQRTIDWAFGGKTKDERLARKGLLPSQTSRPRQAAAPSPAPPVAAAAADHAAAGQAGAAFSPFPAPASQDQAQPDAPIASGAPAVPAAEQAGGEVPQPPYSPPAANSQDQPEAPPWEAAAAEAAPGGTGGGGASDPPPPPPSTPPPPGGDEDVNRGRAVRELQDMFGFEVKRFVQMGRANCVFHIHTDRGVIVIKDAKDLFSFASFRAATLPITGVALALSQKSFSQAVGLMVSITEREDLDMDSSPTGQLIMWLQQYLRATSIYPTWEEARKSDMPMAPHIADGAINMNTSHMALWLQSQRYSVPEGKEIASRLRELGATHKVKAIKARKTSFSFWRLPVDRFDPDDFKVAKEEDAIYGGRTEEQRERVN